MKPSFMQGIILFCIHCNLLKICLQSSYTEGFASYSEMLQVDEKKQFPKKFQRFALTINPFRDKRVPDTGPSRERSAEKIKDEG